MQRKCAACAGPARKTVRAVIVSQDSSPRTGLVCRVCAIHGTLVVPASIRILPPKPRRVPRSAITRAMVSVEPKGGK